MPDTTVQKITAVMTIEISATVRIPGVPPVRSERADSKERTSDSREALH